MLGVCMGTATPSSVYTDVLSSCKSNGPDGCVRGSMVAKTSNFAASCQSGCQEETCHLDRCPPSERAGLARHSKQCSIPARGHAPVFTSNVQRPLWCSQFTAEQRGGAPTESHKHTPVPNRCLYIYKKYIYKH